jgi:nitroreductase
VTLSRLISDTRTIHSFVPGEGPTEAELEACLKLSLLAPNHKKTFPWKIIRASDQLRESLADVSADQKIQTGATQAEAQAARSKSLAAKELIIFVLKKLPNDAFREREDYATLCCSIQLLALSLREKGYGYKWSTGKITRGPEVATLLSLGEQEEVVGFIWAGREAKAPVLGKRPQLAEILEVI